LPFSRIARAAKCGIESLESRVLLSVNVTNYHYNQSETGANTNETILTPTNVNSLTFGKIASLPVDGQVYAQPLIMNSVAMPGGGTEDLVFVATEGDSVYAFNAEGTSTTPVWKTNLVQTGETTIPYQDVGTTDILPQIGITGTPVIDTNTNTLYCVGNFKESNGTYQQRLYALDIATGAAKYGGPVVISGSVSGTGAGSVGGKLSFGAQLENQRPGLTLDNGNVYMAFASHGDNGNYHGWVIAYNETTLVQDYIWCDTPNASQGGIWMSGGAVAVDSSGDLYLTSGNGSFDYNTGGKDLGMALVKLTPQLTVLDYFSPYNESSLSNADEDYGCGNAVLLSGQTGSAPNEALTLGKWGGVYLNNTATGSMGEINNPPNGPNHDLGEAATGLQQHNTFSYWNGQVYVGPDGGKLRDYAVGNSTMSATATSQTAHLFGVGGANGQGTSPTISSNGTTNGIVWGIENVAFNNGPAILYAYNANDLTQLLYASNQYGTRDTAGTAVKFTTPVVANGLVYVGGGGSVTIYGNIPPAPPPPPPPPPLTSATGFSGPITLNAGAGNPAGLPAVSADNNTLTLTTAAGNEASSAFFNAPALLQNFTAGFTYQETGSGPADGITFTLQNSASGDNALGTIGSGLGYSTITSSFAVELNIYQNSSTAVATNGTNNQTLALSNTGAVNLRSGDPINVALGYNSEQWTLTEMLTDTKTHATYSTIYSDINLPTLLGTGSSTGTTNSAYMGFTGGTGGAWAQQTITNFTYTTGNIEPSAPTLPAGATGVSAFANNVLNGTNIDPAGAPAVSADNNTLTLTTATNTEATSAFNKTPVDYGNFNASFTYTGSGAADGAAFTLETVPGLDQTGGQLGYGPAIPNSFAVEFNIYQVSSTSIGAAGAVTVPYTGDTGSVNLASGHPINLSLQYSSSAQTLTESLTDSSTLATDTITYHNVNLAQILGNSPSAYVGFTGGTGGANALQTISGFSYTANTTLPAVQAGPQVNLTGYYTSYGIANAGSADIATGNPSGGLFPIPGNGTTAYDGGGNQLNEAYIGASKSVTDGSGNIQTFNFGPVSTPGVPDVVDAVGQTINLPQGHYGNLSILGSAANGAQQDQPFTVNYTDGTSQTFTQSLSDWWYPGATFPGETVGMSMTDHLNNAGTVAAQGAGQPIDVYEYELALNPAKTVASITLPINDNVKILAINVNAAPNVASVSPTSGPAAGGTTVTINGTGFTGASAVDFGSTPASSFTVNAAGTQITAVDPAGSGTVDVTVITSGGTSATSPADQFSYVVENVAVTGVVINGNNTGLAGVQRSMVDGIVYTFNQAVTLAATNAFTIGVHSGQTGTVPTLAWSAMSADASGASTQWVVTFSGSGVAGGSIGDGVYDLTLDPTKVTSESTPTAPVTPRATDTFYRLFGDINGDGRVNNADYAAFLNTNGLKTGQAGFNAAFDSNGDGRVNNLDYGAFLNNNGLHYSGFTATI
jgi:hypothetical protein